MTRPMGPMACNLDSEYGAERLMSGFAAISEPMSLLKKAGKEAFYKLNITFLLALCRYYFVPLPSKPTLW